MRDGRRGGIEVRRVAGDDVVGDYEVQVRCDGCGRRIEDEGDVVIPVRHGSQDGPTRVCHRRRECRDRMDLPVGDGRVPVRMDLGEWAAELAGRRQ